MRVGDFRVHFDFKWKSESGVTQSRPTLCNSMDCSLPGSSIHGIFPGKNTGVGSRFPLQEIFLTQGLNLGLPHCRQTLYCPSHRGSPLSRNQKQKALQGCFQKMDLKHGSHIASSFISTWCFFFSDWRGGRRGAGGRAGWLSWSHTAIMRK